MQIEFHTKLTNEDGETEEKRYCISTITDEWNDEIASTLLQSLPSYLLQEIEVIELCRGGKVIAHGE
jgi:hypothetical protein